MTLNRLSCIILLIVLSSLSVVGISAQEADCPTDDFIDVQAAPENSAYPAPELSVECTEDSIIVTSNGIPNFEFLQTTPNALTAQNFVWEIPLEPTLAEETTQIPILGTVAFAVNGIPIYGPNEAPQMDYGDPFLDELLDYCNGHTGGTGDYHFHVVPSCIFEEYDGNVGLVVAYALDGFPILAPFLCTDDDCTDFVELNSSWQRTTDVRNAWEAHEYIEGSGDLDQCNGMMMDDGSYAYFATATFPYFLACYVGEVDESITAQNAGGLPQGGEQGGQGQQGQPPQDGQQPTQDGQDGRGQGDGQRPPDGGNGNGGGQGGRP